MMALRVFLFVSFASLFAQAKECRSVFQASDGPRFSTSVAAAKRMTNLVEGPLARRYANDPLVVGLRDRLLGLANKESFELKSETLSGTFRMSLEETVLVYEVPRLIVHENGGGLDLGSRPKGLNLEFAKVLVALTQAARIEAAQNPQIQQVKMVAGHVVNRSLIELLKESGFTMKPPDPAAQAMFRADPMMHWAPGGPGFGHHPYPMDRPFRQSFQRPSSDLSQTWFLRFDIQR